MYSVRAMEWGDIDEVCSIETKAYVSTPWRRQTFNDCLLSGFDCRVLQNSDNQQFPVSGYLICRYTLKICHILNIAIRPEEQNHGLGKFFLSTWLKSLEGSLMELVILEVRTSNANAIKLYKSLGFYEDGRKRNYYQDKEGKEDALVFKLKLGNVPEVFLNKI